MNYLQCPICKSTLFKVVDGKVVCYRTKACGGVLGDIRIPVGDAAYWDGREINTLEGREKYYEKIMKERWSR